MVNMSSRAALPLYKFHSKVHAISFSPDGKFVTTILFLQCHFSQTINYSFNLKKKFKCFNLETFERWQVNLEDSD